MMDLKSLSVPDTGILVKICNDLELHRSYCCSLGEYVNNPGTVIGGSSVPIHILKEFAYSQEKTANIKIPEMKTFVSAIADTACLLGNIYHQPGGLWEVPISKPTEMIDDEILESLDQSIKQLLKEIQGHIKVIGRLQNQQKVCWDLNAKAEKKQAIADEFFKQHAIVTPDAPVTYYNRLPGKLGRKMYKLDEKMRKAKDDVTGNKMIYDELRTKENEIRQKMSKISNEINQTISSRIKSRLNSSVRCLVRATEAFYRACPGRQSTNVRLVLETLAKLDTDVICNDIIKQCSRTYLYPDVEEYADCSKKSQKLPCGKLDERIGNLSMKKTCVQRGKCHLRFSKNLNGYNLKISGRNDAENPIPGYFDLKSDLRVKFKLGLFRGTVGFGWTRKSQYNGQKVWGFFVSPPTAGY